MVKLKISDAVADEARSRASAGSKQAAGDGARIEL